MFMKIFRSDDKFSQMLTQLESHPEYGGGSGSGGCGDDEDGDEDEEDADRSEVYATPFIHHQNPQNKVYVRGDIHVIIVGMRFSNGPFGLLPKITKGFGIDIRWPISQEVVLMGSSPATPIIAIENTWEWRGIANMAFIQLGGVSRVDEMILARVSSGFAGEKYGRTSKLYLGLLGGKECFLGDPGLGKTQLLQAAASVSPRGIYVCGNATTSAGLTVAVVKDSMSGDYSFEAGAMALADRGLCCIDEFDKMSAEHQSLLEAMEQQCVSVAKAVLVASLSAQTTVLAAANPVGGHYNRAKTVNENLKINAALLSRFDLVFILLDKPKRVSEHIIEWSTPAGLKLARENLQSRVKEEDSITDVENAVFDLGVMDSLWPSKLCARAQSEDDMPSRTLTCMEYNRWVFCTAITYDCTRGTKSREESFKKFANNSGIIGGERFCFNPF
ncbi:probable DNA helicase MCM8 [Tanacetum coccineum]